MYRSSQAYRQSLNRVFIFCAHLICVVQPCKSGSPLGLVLYSSVLCIFSILQINFSSSYETYQYLAKLKSILPGPLLSFDLRISKENQMSRIGERNISLNGLIKVFQT